MPFLEVYGFEDSYNRRAALSACLTDAVVEALAISPDIVTIYHVTVASDHYAHAGQLAPDGRRRTFIKVHALERPLAFRRALAARMVDGLVACLAYDPKAVAIYFFERRPDEVAHAGQLESDLGSA